MALVGKLPSWTGGVIPIHRDGVVELYVEINHPGPTSRSCPSCPGGEVLTDTRVCFFLNTSTP